MGFAGAVPYQIRHGGASYDAAEDLRPLGEIQLRLRHATDTTTKRYARKVRYISEVGALPDAIIDFGNMVFTNLGSLLLRRRLEIPSAILRRSSTPRSATQAGRLRAIPFPQ